MIGMVIASLITYYDIKVIDSKTNNDITYFIVNDCIVPIKKKQLKEVNLDVIVDIINKKCKLELDEM